MLLAVTSFATDYSWIGTAADGNFGTSSNWNPEGVPGTDESDTVLFNLSDTTPFTIENDGDCAISAFTMQKGDVMLNLGGKTLSLTSTLTSKRSTATDVSSLTFTNGTINVTNEVWVGPSFGWGGQFRISGSNTVLTAGGRVAMEGTYGVFEVLDGAQVTASLLKCNYRDASIVTVRGTGTVFKTTVAANTQMDWNGISNKFTFADGAEFVSGGRILQSGNDAEITVSGGAKFTLNSSLTLAQGNSTNAVFTASGEGSEIYMIGLYSGNSAFSLSNRIQITKGARFMLPGTAASITIGAKGCGNELRIDEDGTFFITNSASHTYFTVGNSDTAYSNRIVVASGGVLDNRATGSSGTYMRIGAVGACNCLEVENGTVCVTNSNNALEIGGGTHSGYFIASATNNMLLVKGTNSLVNVRQLRFGKDSILRYELSEGGLCRPPIQMKQNIIVLTTASDDPTTYPPRLELDVNNWKPQGRNTITLLTCGTASKSVLDALVATAADSLPAGYTLAASADGKSITLEYRSSGFVIQIR